MAILPTACIVYWEPKYLDCAALFVPVVISLLFLVMELQQRAISSLCFTGQVLFNTYGKVDSITECIGLNQRI
uniref:Uncharacterized protein n=1 Tax=Aegilops tauschii subsp. strangulata TaxID=200361 RepID=A0A452YYR6_AEGTS